MSYFIMNPDVRDQFAQLTTGPEPSKADIKKLGTRIISDVNRTRPGTSTSFEHRTGSEVSPESAMTINGVVSLGRKGGVVAPSGHEMYPFSALTIVFEVRTPATAPPMYLKLRGKYKYDSVGGGVFPSSLSRPQTRPSEFKAPLARQIDELANWRRAKRRRSPPGRPASKRRRSPPGRPVSKRFYS